MKYTFFPQDGQRSINYAQLILTVTNKPGRVNFGTEALVEHVVSYKDVEELFAKLGADSPISILNFVGVKINSEANTLLAKNLGEDKCNLFMLRFDGVTGLDFRALSYALQNNPKIRAVEFNNTEINMDAAEELVRAMQERASKFDVVDPYYQGQSAADPEGKGLYQMYIEFQTPNANDKARNLRTAEQLCKPGKCLSIHIAEGSRGVSDDVRTRIKAGHNEHASPIIYTPPLDTHYVALMLWDKEQKELQREAARPAQSGYCEQFRTAMTAAYERASTLAAENPALVATATTTVVAGVTAIGLALRA